MCYLPKKNVVSKQGLLLSSISKIAYHACDYINNMHPLIHRSPHVDYENQ